MSSLPAEIMEQAERLGIVLPGCAERVTVNHVRDVLPTEAPDGEGAVSRSVQQQGKLGRPRKAFCHNGHDLSVTRRFVNGKAKDCRVCHSDRIRNLRQRMRELEQELDRVKGVA